MCVLAPPPAAEDESTKAASPLRQAAPSDTCGASQNVADPLGQLEVMVTVTLAVAI